MAARLDPATVTGLALTLALGFASAGACCWECSPISCERTPTCSGSTTAWPGGGTRHASALSTHGLNLITQLGSIYTVLALCLVLAVVETVRTRSMWILPFIIAVVGGEELLTNTIKQLADRIRPAFNPAAATLGPSFPSGHSATAAAFYAGAALLLGRQRLRPTRAVARSARGRDRGRSGRSRVLLDVHWLSDVIAGLALGWAWLAACAIAFGGRLLRFGATADAAARVAEAQSPSGSSKAGLRHGDAAETIGKPV